MDRLIGMGQRTSGLRSVLSVPAIYEGFQWVVGSSRVRQTFVEVHLRPEPGQRVLDIGCGPGGILEHLPGVDYHGIDPSEAYIESARQQYGDRGTFEVAGIDDVDADALGRFDLVMAKGVLHHIDDAPARRLFDVAARVMAPGGRLLTLDLGLVEGQSRASRFVVRRDRGRNLRSDHELEALASERFDRVDVTIYHDLLRIPYTHLVLECAEPSAASEG